MIQLLCKFLFFFFVIKFLMYFLLVFFFLNFYFFLFNSFERKKLEIEDDSFFFLFFENNLKYFPMIENHCYIGLEIKFFFLLHICFNFKFFPELSFFILQHSKIAINFNYCLENIGGIYGEASIVKEVCH